MPARMTIPVCERAQRRGRSAIFQSDFPLSHRLEGNLEDVTLMSQELLNLPAVRANEIGNE